MCVRSRSLSQTPKSPRNYTGYFCCCLLSSGFSRYLSVLTWRLTIFWCILRASMFICHSKCVLLFFFCFCSSLSLKYYGHHKLYYGIRLHAVGTYALDMYTHTNTFANGFVSLNFWIALISNNHRVSVSTESLLLSGWECVCVCVASSQIGTHVFMVQYNCNALFGIQHTHRQTLYRYYVVSKQEQQCAFYTMMDYVTFHYETDEYSNPAQTIALHCLWNLRNIFTANVYSIFEIEKHRLAKCQTLFYCLFWTHHKVAEVKR